MIIRYFSDLHLEFINIENIQTILDKIPHGINEICVLAGDIGDPYSKIYDIFIHFISKNFKKAFIIAGNHEFYSKKNTIDDTLEYMINYFKKFDNISFLNNTYEIYDDHCFVGSTLWSTVKNPTYNTNDVYKILNFNYIHNNQLNLNAINFLKDTINNSELPCIVITHHVPLAILIDDKYKTKEIEKYNQWFHSNLDDLVLSLKDKIKYWFYGHTHTPSNMIINNIPFLCNPIGYPYENINVDFNKTIMTSS